MIECECGRKYHGQRVKCVCGLVIEAGKAPVKSFCEHRGDRVGDASCKCGPVFECRLFGVLCGDGLPVDDLVEIKFDSGEPVKLMMWVEYRCCRKCERFENR